MLLSAFRESHLPCTLPRRSDLMLLNSTSDVKLKSSLAFWSTWNVMYVKSVKVMNGLAGRLITMKFVSTVRCYQVFKEELLWEETWTTGCIEAYKHEKNSWRLNLWSDLHFKTRFDPKAWKQSTLETQWLTTAEQRSLSGACFEVVNASERDIL